MWTESQATNVEIHWFGLRKKRSRLRTSSTEHRPVRNNSFMGADFRQVTDQGRGGWWMIPSQYEHIYMMTGSLLWSVWQLCVWFINRLYDKDNRSPVELNCTTCLLLILKFIGWTLLPSFPCRSRAPSPSLSLLPFLKAETRNGLNIRTLR